MAKAEMQIEANKLVEMEVKIKVPSMMTIRFKIVNLLLMLTNWISPIDIVIRKK